MGVDGLTPQQIQQLSEVFRAEAIEHIKSIASVLFSAEDGNTENIDDGINRAFRDAHSLKGSAGTLGFDRVAIIAHRFEDAMGTLRDKKTELDSKKIDILLRTLDVIRQAITVSEPGDEVLTDKECASLELLTKLFNLDNDNNDNKEISPVKSKTSTPEKTVKHTKPQAPVKKEHQRELVRVSQKHIDDVISQFGSLFEAALQVESLKGELVMLKNESARITDGVTALLEKLEGTSYEAETMELLEIAKNLTILSKTTDSKFNLNHRELTKNINRTQTILRELRIAPLSTLEFTIKNQVRDAASKTGKLVSVALIGGEYSVDRAILNEIEKPLIHIIRNSVDHGIESPKDRIAAGKPEQGKMVISASHMGDSVVLSIEDDGNGIDIESIRKKVITNYKINEDEAASLSEEQLIDYLFEPGFSTNENVSQISGRGVGLDVVKFTIEHLGGEVSLTSKKGSGTKIAMRLPLTMSSIKCLLFEAANQVMAIPASNVSRVIGIDNSKLKTIGGGRVLEIEDEQIPVTTFEEALSLKAEDSISEAAEIKFVAIVKFGDRKYAFGFDVIHEYTQLIVKPLGDLLERVPNISGLALLGTGKLCMVLNPGDLIRTVTGSSSGVKRKTTIDTSKKVTTILVVDDSIAIRTMQTNLLESAGFKVLTATDGLKALQSLNSTHVDLVLSDVQMPNMDGFELTAAIKSRDKLKHIPVILITSLGSPADISAGLNAGADAHIIKKELTRHELLQTIDQLL
ncbi:MAG: response regulator [Deltaproteobacteria bacterium]|nr:response regulator [Deltaproteobacteria bacterium]